MLEPESLCFVHFGSIAHNLDNQPSVILEMTYKTNHFNDETVIKR